MLTVLRALVWQAPRTRLTGAIFACVILAGSSFPLALLLRTKRCSLCTLEHSHGPSYEYTAIQLYAARVVKPLYDEHDFNHVIS